MRERRRWLRAGLLPAVAGLLLAPAWCPLWAQAAGERGAADEGGGAATPTVSGFVGSDAAGYTLGPGDVVSVRVLFEEDLSGKHRISEGGTIRMPFVERVQAAGLTTDELTEEITRRLREYIKRPVVQVDLDVESSARHVAVSGTVEKPGPVIVPFGGTLGSAVLMAGTTAQSDLAQVRVTRAGQETFVVNLEGIRRGDAPTESVPARDGDLIYVPKLLGADYSVFGMVMEPGVKPLDPEEADRLDVMRALNAAGGVKEGANLAEATLLRKSGQTETVDLHALLYEGDMSQNRKLSGGDALVVRSADRITVAGEVTEPTSFPAPEPMRLLAALAQAKGLTPQADMKNAMVVRSEGPLMVDLEKLWGQGDLAQNVLVQPGESIIVPTRDPAEVLVVGAVEKPGAIDLHLAKDQSVLRAVQSAIPKPTADLRRVVIQRLGASEPLTVDLRSVTDEGNLLANTQTVSGDLVFVPEFRKVYAAGSFMVPGAHPLTEGMTAIELVGAAGGFREDALPAKMRLIRATPGTGGTQGTPMDFRRLEKGGTQANVPLVEGDILYVPSRNPDRRSWTDILWSVTGVLNLFR